MPLTPFQKGYLAGLLDGEGSLVVFKNTEKRKVGTRTRSRMGFTLGATVKIFNTNLELLNKINEICLGRIYVSTKMNRVPVYAWCLNDKEKIVDLLKQLQPHLIVKAIRAKEMITFCESRINRPSFKSPYTLEEISIAENWKDVNRSSGVHLLTKI